MWPHFIDKNLQAFMIGPPAYCVVLLTIGFYMVVARIAYKQGRAIAALNQPFDTIEASINKKAWKFIKFFGTILGVYLGSILPQFGLSVFIGTRAMDLYMVKVERITNVIYWMNIWINPIIYMWALEDFRKAFKKLVKGNNTQVHAININMQHL